MQPLRVSSPPRAFELQPIYRTNTEADLCVQRTHARNRQEGSAEKGCTRARGRRAPRRSRSENEILIYVSSSTESVTQYLFTAAADVVALMDYYAPQPPGEQEVLADSFARLATFVLEPEEPTDKDVVRRGVYRFPNR